MLKKINKLSFILLLSILFLGCTRGGNNSPTVKFQVPTEIQSSDKLSSMNVSGYVLGHIVVNIKNQETGTQKLWDWDADCDHGCKAPPSEIVINDVKEGANQLIQYLGVYKKIDEDKMVFSYGDIVMDIVKGNNFAEIVATDLGLNGGREATLSGQYITHVSGGNPKGPTGKVAIQFKPPNGSPAMEVGYSEVFNGYFNFFAIEGVPFEYKYLNKVFDQTDDMIFTFEHSSNTYLMNYENLKNTLATTNSMIMANVPSLYYVDHGGNDRDDNRGGPLLFGFVKWQESLAVSPTAYFYNTTVSLPNVYDSQTGGNNLYWKEYDDPTQFSVASGGLGRGDLIPSFNWNTELMLNYEHFTTHSREISGFKGPFKMINADAADGCTWNANEKAFAAACINFTGTEIVFDYQLVNSDMISADALTGVAVFGKFTPKCTNGDCNYHDEYRIKESDGIRCNDFENLGFFKLNDFTSSSEHQHIPFSSINFSMDPSNQDLIMYACPYKVGTAGVRHYFESGVEFRMNYNGGGPTPSTISNIQATSAGDVDGASQWIVDPLGTADLMLTWDTYAGTDYYQIKVRDNSDTVDICPYVNTNAAGSFTLVDCDDELIDSTSQYRLVVQAYDANNNLLAEGETWFYRIVDMPQITTLDTWTCSTWNSPLMKTLNANVHYTGSGGHFEIGVDWQGDANFDNSGSDPATATGQTLSINTGMDDTGTAYSGTITIKGCHGSGFCGPPQNKSFNVDAGGSCTFP